jgi:hypothetical protein
VASRVGGAVASIAGQDHTAGDSFNDSVVDVTT